MDNMFSSLKGFLNRHRRKFIVGGVLVGGIIFITRHTQCKLREWQEKEVREMLERSKRRQYFESTERTCNKVILSLTKTLRESITRILNTESILNKLRTKCDDKVKCWNDLKILAITKSAVTIYSHAMLVIVLRIQINLIGGYLYKESEANETLHTRYMSLCEYFMDNGIKKLTTYVQEKVEEIIAPMSLKDELTLRDLESIYWAITSSVSANSDKDPSMKLYNYMLPEECSNDQDPMFLKIINETIDLMESKEVQELTRNSIQSGFVLLMDRIFEYFADASPLKKENPVENKISIPGTSNQTIERLHKSMGFVDLNKSTIHMAKLIPIVNGQVPDKPTNGDLSDDWIQQLILNKNLQMLGANIYEAFSF